MTGADEVDRVSAGDQALQVVGDGQVSAVVPARDLGLANQFGRLARESSLKPTR